MALNRLEEVSIRVQLELDIEIRHELREVLVWLIQTVKNCDMTSDLSTIECPSQSDSSCSAGDDRDTPLQREKVLNSPVEVRLIALVNQNAAHFCGCGNDIDGRSKGEYRGSGSSTQRTIIRSKRLC